MGVSRMVTSLRRSLGRPQTGECSLTVQGCRPPHKKVPLVAHLIYFRLRWMAPGHKTGGRTKNTPNSSGQSRPLAPAPQCGHRNRQGLSLSYAGGASV